jgi:hypothetical protein
MTSKNNEGKKEMKSSFSFNLGDQMKGLNDEFEKFEKIASNPLALSNIFLGLKTSVDNFNAMLAELNSTLHDIEERLTIIEDKIGKGRERITPVATLGSKDQEVFDFVAARSKTCAEEMQKEFGYKGKHAASARLNKLFTMGLLEKEQSGRTVYYLVKS